MNGKKHLHHKPLRLLKTTTYPTYQLYAIAGNGKLAPEKVLTIAILETISWLRQRFREFEIPPELKWPESSEYDTVDSRDFVSFTIDRGYKVEVIWLPDEKIWTLRLTEPDLGPEPGSTEAQDRQPVPGRMLETNIGYRIISGQVECGFQTLASDPEGSPDNCEVFRLAVIKHLARNLLVGLRDGLNLSDSPYILYNIGEIKSLQNWLKDKNRMMLAVVVAECEPDKTDVSTMPKPENLVFSSPLNSFANLLNIQSTHHDIPDKYLRYSNVLFLEDEKYPIDINKIARYKLGYAQTFMLPYKLIENFRKSTAQNINAGDVFIFEPSYFGGEVIKYNYNSIKTDTNGFCQKLDNFIQNYTKWKPMTFGKVLFVTEAKENESRRTINLKHTKTELMEAFNEQLCAKEERHKNELRQSEGLINLKNEKIDRLNEQISEYREKAMTLRSEIETITVKHENQIREKESEIQRLHALLKRPSRPEDVADWVEKYFAGKMIFHQRAKDMMEALQPKTKDLNLICDALEFLATDYRDELTGSIDKDEMNNRCMCKYGRPFDVVPNKGISVEMYPGEHKIKYNQGDNAKPAEIPLDLHLRVGNDGYNALRIYFLYDKAKKSIVVGSLPHHLRTLSDK